MVECQLPKLDVAGSTPVSRSNILHDLTFLSDRSRYLDYPLRGFFRNNPATKCSGTRTKSSTCRLTPPRRPARESWTSNNHNPSNTNNLQKRQPARLAERRRKPANPKVPAPLQLDTESACPSVQQLGDVERLGDMLVCLWKLARSAHCLPPSSSWRWRSRQSSTVSTTRALWGCAALISCGWSRSGFALALPSARS